MRKSLLFVVLALFVSAFLMACGGAEPEIVEVVVTAPPEVVVEERVVEVTVEVAGDTETIVETVVEEVPVTVEVIQEVIVEATATPVPDRNGAYLDKIIFVEEPNQDSAIARLAAGDVDMFADDVGGSAIVQSIEDAGNITTVTQYGLYDEMFFNNSACADENIFNPFQNVKIREAMNYAIDRDFVADELYAGLAVPKYTPISEAGADRGRYAAEIRAIEAKYAYNFETANEIVTAEMEGMGAELVDGVWNWNGEPITLINLIRIEDARLEIGNYFANQLEEMGFLTERIERVSSELSPLWLRSDTTECQWHVYTGAWSQTAISRSDTDNFDFFYTPRGLPFPSWESFTPTEEFDALSLRLNNNDYADLAERDALMAEMLPMALEMSTRVWVTSRTTLVPFSEDVAVSTDLAAGVSGAGIWAKTARFKDQLGGTMTIALPSVFTEPYNPIGGTNWVFDNMVKRAIGESGVYADPNTGLSIPNRIESASVVVESGFPASVSPSSSWVTLEFEDEIVVPDDAWAGWDAANQVFLSAADVYTETQTAVYKSTVVYPSDMFDTLTWHDGSLISPADFVNNMIITFDLANPDSPYYDEAQVPDLDQFLSSFKGMRVVSTDPLTIEHYADNAQLDAENMVVTWWPDTGLADIAWHNMGLMLRGEENGAFALTPAKADAAEIELTNMIAGPSLETFATELTAATEEGWIPYEGTLGAFITADEAAERYANLAEFARRYGHYYLGTNVYFMSGVFPVEGQAVLSRYAAHPDPVDKFAGFSSPAIAEVFVDGDSSVTIGDEVAFDVFIDDPDANQYAVDDIGSVSYLLFDATGAQVEQGTAEAVEDGLWTVTLSEETTSALEEGSNRLEIVVVSNLVALPSLGEYQFVTTP